LSEEEIFENHFGGFYYVFVRGCKENTSNAIYAHTWNNYSELKKDYESIKKSFAV
jgi:exodeoxyribonuclease V beta subunit